MGQSVNANIYFPVSASVINTGSGSLTFAGVFSDENSIIPAGTDQSVLAFYSAAAVGAFFGLNSTEYLHVAIPYFRGFNGSDQKPSVIYFAKYVNAQQNARLYGSTVSASISQFEAITSGSITFHVNGTSYAVSSIDLSAASSYSLVASTVLADLISAHSNFSAATLTYNSVTGAFDFDTGLGTGTDTIAWCSTGTLAGYMGFQTAPDTAGVIVPGVGYLSQGSASLTTTQNLDNILTVTLNFGSIAHVDDTSSDTAYVKDIAFSTWANNNGYAFFAYNTLGAAAAIAETNALVATTNAGTAPVCGSLDIASAAMGFAGCVNYNQINGVIGWAWKSQSGLVPSVTVTTDAQDLIAANCNFYQAMSNADNTFNSFQQGKITGQFTFIQNFFNQMWLANKLQSAVIALFQNAKIVSYDAQGYQLIYAALSSVLTQARTNGVVTSGNAFSPDQVALMQSQAGIDISSEMTNQGYYIQIQAVTGDQRASNVPPPTTIWYTNGGIILTLPLNTVFVE